MDSNKAAIAICTLPPNFGDRDYYLYQEKILRIYANAHGIRIIRVVKENLDTMYYRYEINSLRNLITKKAIDIVLIQDKYRLFDNYYECLNFEAFCGFHGVKIISINDIKNYRRQHDLRKT